MGNIQSSPLVFVCVRTKLLAIYERLLETFGPQHWWPGETAFEVMLGAILTQNTAWRNVELAINNLKEHSLIDIQRLADTDKAQLETLIRSSGYFRQKAERLKLLAKYLSDHYNCDIDRFFNRPLQVVREELLELKGIGPETADSMLLYAGNKPVFVIDAYTFRIFRRLGLYPDEKKKYERLQKLFMDNLGPDVKLYNEYHALLVELGKTICTPGPKCNSCPLVSFCPTGKQRSTEDDLEKAVH